MHSSNKLAFVLYAVFYCIYGSFKTGNAELTNTGRLAYRNDRSDDSNLAAHVRFKTADFGAGVRHKQKLEWWQTEVIYEIYPRSFKDTTGNGIGDLRGIIEKLPYLKDLGIGAIWITPIYTSPGFDLGYDISDYRSIDRLMGSMDDFDELITKFHENGIKVLLDLVPNHTSDEHEWFVKSVQKIEPYTDYYVWANAKYDVNGTRQVPNNWDSEFGGSPWEWNEQRQQYYYHQFYKLQPDLNFWNPLVREEIKNVMRFWLDKGVDGFRLDAISFLYEREDLMSAPLYPHTNEPQKEGYYKVLDATFDEVTAWRSVLDEYKAKDGEPRIIIVESYLAVAYEKRFYGNSTHPGAHFPLSLPLGHLHRSREAKYYVDTLSKFLQELPSNAWASWNIGNHDMARSASSYGAELIDGIRMMQLLLPGTPCVYMADELGMPETELRRDQLIEQLELYDFPPREKCRTPFQWDATAQAGFSEKTKTWLPVNPNYVTLNADYQTNVATRSHLRVFKELVKLRRSEAFRSGDLNFYVVSKHVLAFSRNDGFFKSYFVVVNLGSEMENVDLMKLNRMISKKMTVKVASLYAEQNSGDVVHSNSFTLRPSAALVLESSYILTIDK